jgi:hypothetical protein
MCLSDGRCARKSIENSSGITQDGQVNGQSVITVDGDTVLCQVDDGDDRKLRRRNVNLGIRSCTASFRYACDANLSREATRLVSAPRWTILKTRRGTSPQIAASAIFTVTMTGICIMYPRQSCRGLFLPVLCRVLEENAYC